LRLLRDRFEHPEKSHASNCEKRSSLHYRVTLRRLRLNPPQPSPPSSRHPRTDQGRRPVDRRIRWHLASYLDH
jgi:hypothetical protein